MSSKVDTIYPLWKVVYQEEDCYDRKIDYCVVSCLPNTTLGWIDIYKTTSIEEAFVALDKLKIKYNEVILPFILNQVPKMCKVHNNMYRILCISPMQSKVYCDNIMIDGENKSFYSINTEFDYIKDDITFYKKDELVVYNNYVFCNGDMIFNDRQFFELCDIIKQDKSTFDKSCRKFINYIKKNYPLLKYFSGGKYLHYDLGGTDG